MPRFPYDEGECDSHPQRCADDALVSYIYKHLQYPAIAEQNGIEGMNVVSFVIGEDGRISDIELLRDIGAETGDEVIRLMEQMQEEIIWTPGKQRGSPVNVKYNLPIRFKLE